MYVIQIINYNLWYTYSFSFFNISVATTRVLSQSDGSISVEDILLINWGISQVITPKLQTISMLWKKLPCDENELFVLDEPNNIRAKSSLLSSSN